MACCEKCSVSTRIYDNNLKKTSTFDALKPSAHSRFLSLRHAIVGFSSCRTQQILSLIDTKLEALLCEIFFKRCVGMILRGKFACQHSYLCFSIGLLSHVFHNFCRDTPHTADFCFWSLAIKNKYQTCLNSKLSLLRQKSLVLSYRTQQIF